MTTPVEITRHFDRELGNLKQDLLRMAALAETAVGKSVESVTNRDSDRAREVIIDDIPLNRMELAIEEPLRIASCGAEPTTAFEPLAWSCAKGVPLQHTIPSANRRRPGALAPQLGRLGPSEVPKRGAVG